MGTHLARLCNALDARTPGDTGSFDLFTRIRSAPDVLRAEVGVDDVRLDAWGSLVPGWVGGVGQYEEDLVAVAEDIVLGLARGEEVLSWGVSVLRYASLAERQPVQEVLQVCETAIRVDPDSFRILPSLADQRRTLEPWTDTGARGRVLDVFSLVPTLRVRMHLALEVADPRPEQGLDPLLREAVDEGHLYFGITREEWATRLGRADEAIRAARGR